MDPRISRDRIVDASLNRAAEGLRVAEDLCRFHWNLEGYAKELKDLRHDLLAAGRGNFEVHRTLLRARDIEGDVGRSSGVAEETGRTAAGESTEALEEAAFRNLERAREALRTLEEVLRGDDPQLAGRFESLRYRLYSLEKGVAGLRTPSDRAPRLEASRLCLLATASLCRRPLLETVGQAVDAGVDIVQLREKSLSDAEWIREARSLRELTSRRGILFIINDRPDIALLCHADGVHLGQDDLPVAEARSLVGQDLLIGVSTHSLEQARRAVSEGADYVGVGPVFATRTKDAGPALGPRGLGEILVEVPVPAFAIGGIRPENLSEVLRAGAKRAAASSGILSNADVSGTVAKLRGLLES